MKSLLYGKHILKGTPMWMPIILLCSAPYSESCIVVTGEELLSTQQECFKVSTEKAREALRFPNVYQARPFCQIIPKIKGEVDT